MKKLILITAMAVAASWLLHEARLTDRNELVLTDSHGPKAPGHGKKAPKRVLVRDDGETSSGSIRTIPGKPARGQAKASATGIQGKSAPPWFPESVADESNQSKTDPAGYRVVLGRLSASPDRALQDLRETVDREVKLWIAADVPTSWNVPARATDALVEGTYVQELTKDLTPDTPEFEGLYTLYRAGQRLNFSNNRRAEIVRMYRRELASTRTKRLGGGIALALVTLAVLSGYIKADEATKGYYTNRLRLAAAAGLGAAGAAAYRFLV